MGQVAFPWIEDKAGEIVNVGNHLLPSGTFHPGGGEVLTKQADAYEADINRIMSRWVNNGVPPTGTALRASYGDFSSGDDYLECMNKVLAMEEAFDSLPAHVRQACNNDPAELLDMVFDPEKVEKCREIGLLEEQLPEKVQKVEIVGDKPPVDKPAQPAT